MNDIQWDLQPLIEQKRLNSDPDWSAITMKLALLKEELAVFIEIMINEVGEMQKFAHERPNAKFLVDIEKCAANVSEAAMNLLAMIEQLERQLNSDLALELSTDLLNECARRNEELEKNVKLIPTVMKLKEKYGNQ